ncbi:hypothetical protein HCN44_007271 [Aphidius gifuensis]|uniref:DNA repair and recombination protein RAD54-like n=1 Tax=Aphidius gifuensis TaxID=684658 RepID=A0A834XLM1_APHGI|nr:hypothetical protein HCN44_007271 [Aphidius gifuensis]
MNGELIDWCLPEVVKVQSENDIQQEIANKIDELSKSRTSNLEDGEIVDEKNNNTVAIDKQVQNGEITPFEAEFKKKTQPSSIKNTFNSVSGLLDLEKYLKRQAEVGAQRKNLKIQKNTVKTTSIECQKNKKSIKQVKRKSKNIDSTNDKSSSLKIVNENKAEIIDEKINNCMKNSSDSGSEYIPSADEIDSDDEKFKKKLSKKRKRLNKDDQYKDNNLKKRILDDGDESLWKKRIENKKNYLNTKQSDLKVVDNLFKVPKLIWKKLYEYQKVSVRWLWELHGRGLGGLLGDEMGLGKTVQIIAFLAGLDCSELLSDGSRFRGLGPTLIICPATLLEQWVEHFHNWSPCLRVVSLHQSSTFNGDTDELLDSLKSGGILLSSYSGVLRNAEFLLPYQWHYVILDEGHKIRNPQAKITKVVKKFTTPHRLLLTGSPMQNSLKELWSLFDFILPGKLGTIDAFIEHCAGPITRGGYSNATPLQEATALHIATMLKDAISPYMIRRTKNDVQHHLKLPDKNEQVLFCCLTDEQSDLYKNYLISENIRTMVHEKNFTNGHHRAKLLVALTSLRKICNHPDLFTLSNDNDDVDVDKIINDEDDDDIEIDLSKFGNWKKSGKMTVVRSLLKIWKRQKHRAVIFTQSRQMMHVLENLVQQENYKYIRLDGTTPMSERQTCIRNFNENEDYFVFISTTRVGGLGINLTGADRVIIYDPDWNPATDAQARERTWRIGQNKKVTIYRLITAGTIEEKIYHRQIFKILLSKKVLDDPRQKRIFQTSDLSELFNLNEPIDGSITESNKLFKNSNIIIKKKNISANFEGEKVDYLVGKRFTTNNNQDEQVIDDDSYVLNKLFSKSSLNSAMGYDNVLSSANCDDTSITPMQRMARETAQESMDFIRQSRKWCHKLSWE